MPIEESENFIKQVIKLKKKFRNIEDDIRSLKEELPKLAFRSVFPLNIHIVTVTKTENFCRNVWRIRLINSDNNKGKSGGYRIFYCEGKVEKSVLLLGIYPKQEIKNNEYEVIGRNLVAACFS